MLYHRNHSVRDSSRNVQYRLLHLIFCVSHWSWLCNSWETEGRMQLFPTLNGEIYCCSGGNSQLFENDFTTQGWSPNDSSFVLEIVHNLISLFEIMKVIKSCFMFGVGGSAGHFGSYLHMFVISLVITGSLFCYHQSCMERTCLVKC